MLKKIRLFKDSKWAWISEIMKAKLQSKKRLGCWIASGIPIYLIMVWLVCTLVLDLLKLVTTYTNIEKWKTRQILNINLLQLRIYVIFPIAYLGNSKGEEAPLLKLRINLTGTYLGMGALPNIINFLQPILSNIYSTILTWHFKLSCRLIIIK
jgi:hypothetical protein